jgi:hypothetical protein
VNLTYGCSFMGKNAEILAPTPRAADDRTFHVFGIAKT